MKLRKSSNAGNGPIINFMANLTLSEEDEMSTKVIESSMYNQVKVPVRLIDVLVLIVSVWGDITCKPQHPAGHCHPSCKGQLLKQSKYTVEQPLSSFACMPHTNTTEPFQSQWWHSSVTSWNTPFSSYCFAIVPVRSSSISTTSGSMLQGMRNPGKTFEVSL